MTRIDLPQTGWVEPGSHDRQPAAVPSLESGAEPGSAILSGALRAEGLGVPPEPDATPEADRGLSGERPWSRSGFWLLQLVVLALYLIRLAATVAFHVGSTSLILEFSTLALFIIPVVYAALNFGLAGAAITTGWISVLAIPRIISAIQSHQYVDAWAELVQVVLLDALAVLIGQRVSAERAARRSAETSREAHLRAEAMYRDLFDSNQAPILIIDVDGCVVETNASAQRAFSRQPAATPGAPVRLVDMIGADAAARVLTELLSWRLPRSEGTELSASDPGRIEPLPFDIGGERVLFRPTATMLGPGDDTQRMQVIFEDVTAETLRHDLMEAYAAQRRVGARGGASTHRAGASRWTPADAHPPLSTDR